MRVCACKREREGANIRCCRGGRRVRRRRRRETGAAEGTTGSGNGTGSGAAGTEVEISRAAYSPRFTAAGSGLGGGGRRYCRKPAAPGRRRRGRTHDRVVRYGRETLRGRGRRRPAALTRPRDRPPVRLLSPAASVRPCLPLHIIIITFLNLSSRVRIIHAHGARPPALVRRTPRKSAHCVPAIVFAYSYYTPVLTVSEFAFGRNRDTFV